MASSLPLDVHYSIIDHLRDKSALFSCALVCHAWLHPARTHLFDTLVIQVTKTALVSFPAYLDAHGNAVRPYVKTLRLWQARRYPDFDSIPDPELDIETLSAILSHLSGLRTLHLQNLYLQGWCDVMSHPYPGPHPPRFCLDVLQIDECVCGSRRLDSLVDIVEFICLFSRVRSLTLAMEYWDQPDDHVPLPSSWQPPHTIEIDELIAKVNELWWEETAGILGRLVGRSPGPRAMAFRCGSQRHWPDVRAIGALLGVAGIGMHLRRLELNFSFMYLQGSYSTEQVTAALSLASLPYLEDVRFILFLLTFEETDGDARVYSRLCADMLSTATRLSTLTRVNVTIQASKGQPAQLSETTIDWDYLGKSFRDLQFLRRVDVLFKCITAEATPDDDRALLLTRQGLSAAAAKRILHVQIEYGCKDMFD